MSPPSSATIPDIPTDPAPVQARVTPRPGRRRDRWVSSGIAMLTFAVYLRSLLPGIGYSGDTAKWQLLGEVGGVPHATGYPLYVALDQAGVWLVPWGSVAWRVNLLSAVFAVAVVVVTYRLLRILDVRWDVAAATTLTFAFTTTFWTQAVVAEVYTLHVLFVASVTTCLARWRLGGANGWLLAGLTLYAVSFGHHLTIGLALPGVVWLVWSDWRRALKPGNVVWVAVALVLSASQYLYLVHMTRTGGYVEGRIESPGDIVEYVTGGPFKDQMFTFGPGELLTDRLPLLADFLRHEYLVLLAPIAYGVWRAVRTWDGPRRDVAVCLLLLGVGTGVYVMNFDVPDVVVFALPLYWALAVFLGVGLQGIVELIRARLPTGWSTRRAASAVTVGLLAIPLVTGLVDYRRSSQRGSTTDAARIERLLAAADSHAVLLTGSYDDSEFIWYHLKAEHMAATRDLVMVHLATPETVRQYLRSGTGPVAAIAAHVDRDDPPLYVASANLAADLAEAGIPVSEVARDVWRVD